MVIRIGCVQVWTHGRIKSPRQYFRLYGSLNCGPDLASLERISLLVPDSNRLYGTAVGHVSNNNMKSTLLHTNTCYISRIKQQGIYTSYDK